MSHTSRFKRLLLRFVSRRHITIAGVITAVLVVFFSGITVFYYFTTPPSAIIVTTTDFPPTLVTNFTTTNLNDQVVGRLLKIVNFADSRAGQDLSRQEGLGARAVKEELVLRAFSTSLSPISNLKWKGLSINLCRYIGMSLRAKGFLELNAIGVPQGGWRLTASLKESPHFLARQAGSAPQDGGACPSLENCTDELTEQVLRALDSRRLLNYYIKTDTPDANRKILELYQTLSAAPAPSLQAEDFVAWGNAFYRLGEFAEASLKRDEARENFGKALQKYQDALEKDSTFWQARVARGFVFKKSSNFKQAEEDFRYGIERDPKNEFTRTALCHTLLQEWRNAEPHDPASPLLVEAKEQCEKALEVKPSFVTAGINIGYILYRQKSRREALSYFDKLSQRYPTESALFVNYGYLLYLEYLEDHSAETLRRATAQTLQAWNLNRKSDAAATNLGFFYYEQGDYTQAVDFWKQASVLKTTDPDCIAGLALGTYKLGDQRAALAHLSRATQMDPHYGDPAYVKEHNGWSDRAASDLAKLVRLLPK